MKEYKLAFTLVNDDEATTETIEVVTNESTILDIQAGHLKVRSLLPKEEKRKIMSVFAYFQDDNIKAPPTKFEVVK